MRGKHINARKTWRATSNDGTEKGIMHKRGQPSEQQVHTLEELAVADLINKAADNAGVLGNSTDVQNLVLSLTGSSRKLGYNFGFFIGKQISQYSNGGIGALSNALEKLGIGKVLYHPSHGYAIITSVKPKPGTVKLGIPVHILEAGIIAGYMSGHLGEPVTVRESMCTYLNSDICQFVAEPISEGAAAQDEAVPEPMRAIEAMAHSVKSLDQWSSSRENYFALLPDMPLSNKYLLQETSDLMYLAGAKLAGLSEKSDFEKTLGKIARYFDLAGAEVASRGGKKVIILRYKQYNSTTELVELSSSMAAGFIETLLGRSTKRSSGVSEDKSYFVEFRVMA
ncbi:MAG: V4R domain-containing protein [Candidatus Micrarchaeaceae archaeon]